MKNSISNTNRMYAKYENVKTKDNINTEVNIRLIIFDNKLLENIYEYSAIGIIKSNTAAAINDEFVVL
jgi:hypothetical protein